MAKREALGQMEQDVAGVGALVLREGECEPEAPYDEDDPDAFLAQQVVVCLTNPGPPPSLFSSSLTARRISAARRSLSLYALHALCRTL
jgi:hypothetical protein